MTPTTKNSTRKQRMSPQEAQTVADHARQHVPCQDCQAPPGEPCTRPGKGRSVCKTRYIAAAIAIRRAAKAATRTPEQEAELAATLAALPRIPREQIESCKTERGGYRFTREQLALWGIPWPPPPGWRQAIQRGDNPDPDTRTAP